MEGILREHYLSKGKPKIIFLSTKLTSLRRLESESITDYIIRTENISNSLKEAGEFINKVSKVKLSPFSQGRPEGSLFNSYYTEV